MTHAPTPPAEHREADDLDPRSPPLLEPAVEDLGLVVLGAEVTDAGADGVRVDGRCGAFSVRLFLPPGAVPAGACAVALRVVLAPADPEAPPSAATPFGALLGAA